MYIRKTYDEYEIQSNNGYGWDVENTEENLKDAKRSLKEYMENMKAPIRLVKKRIPIEEK